MEVEIGSLQELEDCAHCSQQKTRLSPSSWNRYQDPSLVVSSEMRTRFFRWKPEAQERMFYEFLDAAGFGDFNIWHRHNIENDLTQVSPIRHAKHFPF